MVSFARAAPDGGGSCPRVPGRLASRQSGEGATGFLFRVEGLGSRVEGLGFYICLPEGKVRQKVLMRVSCSRYIRPLIQNIQGHIVVYKV